MPRASIIIPCYNAEKYLAATLKSALAQTERDTEVICVDNRSTDSTPNILAKAAQSDARVRVFRENVPGEGPARQAGLAQATGEWLYFLDADDLMEPQLLERAIARGESEDADLVIFRTLTLNDVTGEVLPISYSFMRDWLPDGTQTFDPHDHPERILNSFQNWVHNKLFRASFVRDHGLSFQPVHRTADLLFTCRALTEAHRIALLDEALHRYRINNSQSAMATSDTYPLDFFKALLALRKALEGNGTWELYHDSFVSWAAVSIIANLETARSLEGFRTIADEMKRGGLEKVDLVNVDAGLMDSPWHYRRILDIRDLPLTELLFTHYADLKIRRDGCEDHASRVRMENARLRDELAQRDRRAHELEGALARRDEDVRHITSSVSFRLGRAVTAPGRSLRDRLSRRDG
jgi:glycosyltransferase EpsH